MKKIPDSLKAEVLAEYRRGGITQEEACKAFTARTGLPLSGRTLRSWLSGSASAGVDRQAVARSLRGLRQRLRDVAAEVERLLVDLEVVPTGGLETNDVESRVARQAALPVPTGSRRLTPGPQRDDTTSHAAVPLDAAAAPAVASILPVGPAAAAAAAPVPIGNDVEPGRRLKSAFWDDLGL